MLKALQHSVFFQQGMWKHVIEVLEQYPKLHDVSPCNGLQGAVAQYTANQTRNTGANPFSFQ